jgi:acetolactate synthase-1/2/3 large subunit
MFDPNRQRIVQIDIEPRNASWTIPAEVALCGDARRTLHLLRERLDERIDKADARERRHSYASLKAARDHFVQALGLPDRVPMLPQRLVAEICAATPEDAIVCSDAGNNRHWMNHFFQTRRAGCYFGTGGLGGVSWSLAGTLCAAAVAPERPSIGVSSDGGLAMQIHVLLTAIQYRLRPIYVVMNNSRFGMTSEGMGNRAVGNEFPETDYSAIARGFGAFAERVERPQDVRPAILAALAQDWPAVIDVLIDKTESMREAIYSPLALEAQSGARPR